MDEKKIEINYKVTLEEYRQYNKEYLKARGTKFKIIIGYLVLSQIIFAVIILSSEMNKSYSVIPLGISLGIIIIYLGVKLIWKHSIKKQYGNDKISKSIQHIQIDNEGISNYLDDDNKSYFKWNEIIFIYDLKHFYGIHINQINGFLIPKKYLKENDIQLLNDIKRTYFKRVLGKRKIYKRKKHIS